jgi:ABC-type transport system involved in cytochrome c biogenesis permease subunit
VTSAINSRSQLTFAGSMPLAASTTTIDSGTSARYASILTVNAFVFLTASLLLRTVVSRHAPFSNMFEFSLAFSWGALGLSIYFENRYRLHMLTLLVIPVVVGLLAYATTVPDSVEPLAPALQNNLLLTAHVTMAILAYGAFTVAFAAGVLYLVQRRNGVRWLPRNVVLDEVGYRAVLGLLLDVGPEGDGSAGLLAHLRRLLARPRPSRLARRPERPAPHRRIWGHAVLLLRQPLFRRYAQLCLRSSRFSFPMPSRRRRLIQPA